MVTGGLPLGGAFVSFSALWFTAGHTLAESVSHESVVFSMPVVLSAVGATACFIWWAAKIDAKRSAKIEMLTHDLKLLSSTREARHEEIMARLDALARDVKVLRRAKRRLVEAHRKIEKRLPPIAGD